MSSLHVFCMIAYWLLVLKTAHGLELSLGHCMAFPIESFERRKHRDLISLCSHRFLWLQIYIG